MLQLKRIISILLLIIFSSIAKTETSANIGVVSQYHFRGIQQTTGASASAGLNYTKSGFSLGTWVADVSDGLEVDLYGSYSFELENGLSFGLGATTYQYTGNFDSAYNEINLSAAFKSFQLGYSVGKWDGNIGNKAATEANYTILTLAFAHQGFTGTLGVYGDETKGEYFDLNYAKTIGGFDVTVGLLISGRDLDNDESLYFGFSKTFEL